MILFGISLTVIIGALTLLTVLAAAGLGVALLKFGKGSMDLHRYAAMIAVALAFVHAFLALAPYLGISV